MPRTGLRVPAAALTLEAWPVGRPGQSIRTARPGTAAALRRGRPRPGGLADGPPGTGPGFPARNGQGACWSAAVT